MPITADTTVNCVHAVDVRATAGEALQQMTELGAPWLAVVRDGSVVGLVEKRDLLRAQEADHDSQRGVWDVVDEADVRLVWLEI